jgi:two-component system NtrC family sensor kinase
VYHSSLDAKTSVEVNRNQLLQILVNLQMNAIHAMDGEGNLTISSEDWIEDGVVQGAVIHVEDEGCGIKEEQLKRIFSPFYTTKRDGTGLGLSVSQSILSQTGGEIRVESELGKGSRFSVYLPKKAAPQLLVSNVN